LFQERRRSPRYRIDSTIEVNGGSGRTIDISATSVYFESRRRFTPGEQVAIVFPLERTGPGASVKCAAEIVRVDARGEMFGVAATYEPVAFSVSQ
jgi:hypothetical protein